MKKNYLIMTVLFTILILTGCGHFGEGDPIGVTGGGNSGYGEDSNSMEPINLNSALILGEWKRTYSSDNYYVWSFEPNGDFKQTDYEYGNINEMHGTYEIIKNQTTFDQLRIDFDNGNFYLYYFKIENNILYLLYSDGSIRRVLEKL